MQVSAWLGKRPAERSYLGGGLAAQTISAGSSTIVDLTGSVVNTGSALPVTIGANSLLIVSPGFNASTFHSFTTLALTHTLGTTLTLASSQGFGGAGTIADRVVCQGTINATAGFGINLSGGLAVSSPGNVNLGNGALIVNDLVSSSMTSGSLTAATIAVEANHQRSRPASRSRAESAP